MKSAEGRGRTLDEAVDAALIELKESRRNVDIKVISEGSEEPVVEVTVIDHTAATAESPAPANGKAEVARGLVEGLLKHMGVRAQVTVRTGTDPITLDAMQPFERRAIHLALEGDPDVTSGSIGEEPERRVVVGPRKPAG